MKKQVYVLLCVCILLTEPLAAPPAASSTKVDLVRTTAEGIVLELTLPHISFEDAPGGTGVAIDAEGCAVIPTPGAPGILVKGVLIALPPEGDFYVQANVLDTETVDQIMLAPSPEKIRAEHADGSISLIKQFNRDRDRYGADELFPEKLVEVASTGYLRDLRVARLNIFPVQYNPVKKLLQLHRKIRVLVRYAPGMTTGTQAGTDSSRRQTVSGVFENIYKSCLINYSVDQIQRQLGAVPSAKVQSAALLSPQLQASPFAVRAVIAQEGVYKVTYEDLSALGVDLSAATNENLMVENQGVEIAVYCSGTGKFSAGDYLLFYGKDIKTLYTRKNIYWIYQGQNDGKRMAVRSAAPDSGYAQQTVFWNTLHAEEDNRHSQHLPPHEEGADHWFWESLSINEEPLAKDFTVSLHNRDSSSGNYSFAINLRAKTNPTVHPNHHTRIYVNDTLVDDFTWDSDDALYNLTRTREDIPADAFTDGDNTVTVEAVNDLGLSVDQYFINWFEIGYWDRLHAEDNYLKFNTTEGSGAQLRATGFADDDIWVFDATDEADVTIIENATIESSGSTYTVTFEDGGTQQRTYCVLDSRKFLSPEDITVDEQSDLGMGRSAVDYIIIYHKRFAEGVKELKEYRESKGLTVAIAEIQDVYDEFSYGLKDAAAIRGFLTFAYKSWHTDGHPTYVLLVGDASVDYRDDLGYYQNGKEDLVPTALYQTTTLGDTPTDNWFACVEGSDYLPDMIIGRLCVKTENDLQNIIDKIKEYEKADMGAWCGNVIFAADDETMFESISDSLQAMLPEGFTSKEVYMSQYENTAAATNDFVEQINAGSVLTNYTGHGHVSEWASPYLFHTPDFRGSERNDVESLSNGDRLSFFTVLNCMSGYFAGWEVDYAIAEELVRAENKGAIACLASTSAGYPSEHQVLAKKIFQNLFSAGNNIAGALVTAGKIQTYEQIYSRDIVETFALFGDPAVELKLVPGSAFTDFALKTPDEDEALPKMPPATFTWGMGLYDRFRVQFSSETGFAPESTLTAPLIPYIFIYDDQYTPNMLIWSLLRRMGKRNETVFWRVAAYDENFNFIASTEPLSFSFED